MWTTASELRDVEQALREHPRSSELLVLRGDFIQLCDGDSPDHVLSQALVSYRRANELAPDAPEPLMEIGNYLDAVEDDPAGAVPYFQAAVAKGGGQAAADALAKAMEQVEY